VQLPTDASEFAGRFKTRSLICQPSPKRYFVNLRGTLRTSNTFLTMRPVEGWQERSQSSTDVATRLNHENHSKVCLHRMALSPKTVLSISCVSAAVSPSLKQK
jgi:hypothetical protein